MYNLIEYSSDYSETLGSLWFYSKNGATNFNAEISNNDDFKSYTDKFLKPICCKYTVKVYVFVMTNAVKQCKLIEVNKFL